jgi:hypothetical protein
MQKVLTNLISYKNEIFQLSWSSKETAFELVWLSRRVADYIYSSELEDQFKKEVPALLKKHAGNLATTSNTANSKALKGHFEKTRDTIVSDLTGFINQLNSTSSASSV